MDLRDTSEEADFRRRLRVWLEDNLPTEPQPNRMPDHFRYTCLWQRALYRGGWVALSWPRAYGGQGLGPVEEAILSEELGRASAPAPLPLTYLGRPILSHGTENQKLRYLPKLLSAEEIWCQGFSEPEAGSDLASLQCRATLTSEGWRINGHKIWTSYGHLADLCLLLARTDPDAPKHNGISAFILPLSTPGVTVRPIVLANGTEEFAEIFIDDVVIPVTSVIGHVGQGWTIAMDTVVFERGAVDVGYQARYSGYLTELIGELPREEIPDATLAPIAIGDAIVSLEVLRIHSLRRLSARKVGRLPGPESSIDKLLMTYVEQHLMQAAVSLSLGDLTTPREGKWFDRYIFSRAGSIYGGSAEIQKNILARQVLDLH